MLINPNLLTENKVELKPIDSTHNYTAIEIPNNLEEGKTYIFSFLCNYHGVTEGTVSIANDKNIAFTSNRFIGKSGVTNEILIKYNKEWHANILFYAGIAGQTNHLTAQIYNIKLEEGDRATPYIPHKDLIDPSKQAVFVAGGVFQEVYPI